MVENKTKEKPVAAQRVFVVLDKFRSFPLIKPQKRKSVRATTEIAFSLFCVPQNVPKKTRKFFLDF
jgi:hypothetical protein